MCRRRLVKNFLIGMGICLSLVSMAHTAWAGCEQRVSGNGQYFFTGSLSHPMPKGLSPGGASTVPDLNDATYLYADTGDATPICRSVMINGWYNIANWDDAADYWYVWADSSCNQPYGPYYRGIHIIYYKKNPPPSPSSNDYDCDETPDSDDQHPGEASNQKKNLGFPLGACPFVGNPTNVATGNKYEEVLDLSLSTPGMPLEFRRSYNSQVPSDGPLGYGWTHNYDLSVQVVQETAPKRMHHLGFGWSGALL